MTKREIYALITLFWIAFSFINCNQIKDPVVNPETSFPLFEAVKMEHSQVTFKQNNGVPAGDKTGLLSGGAGVAIGDIDNDGLADIIFSGGYQNSRLYKNNGGFSFTDITETSGLNDAKEGVAHTEGINLVDLNGDGWLDIFLCKSGLRLDDQNNFTGYGKNLLYINQQNGTFTEQSASFGLDLIGLTSSAQFFDYDRDGDLDVYLAQLPEVGAAFSFAYYDRPPAHSVLSDRLYENRSNKFIDVSDQAGILFERNLSLSTTVLDINLDHWPDLYVANDFFGRDFLYINQKDGTFKESLLQYFSKTTMSSMGSDVGDINNDGYPDLFVGEMMPHHYERQKTNLVPFSLEIYDRLQRTGYPQYTRNMLFLNIDGNGMQEIGLMADVYATEWSWGALFFDANMDGQEDLFIANGIRRDMTNMDFVKQNVGEQYTRMADPNIQASVDPDLAPTFTSSNFMYLNKNGFEFEDVTDSWGLDEPQHTRGAAFGDLDNDGDLDLVWNNIENPPSIFRNQASKQPSFHFLKIRLEGKSQNTHAFGAQVRLSQAEKMQTKYISSQRGFHSMPDPSLCFAVQDTLIDWVEIYWPDGTLQKVSQIEPDQFMVINQSGTKIQEERSAEPILGEVTALDFIHSEKPYNDFKQERLLSQQYSKLGPALALADINQDGMVDIFVGGSSGQSGKLFVQNNQNQFTTHISQPWQDDLFSEDVCAEFIDVNNDQAPDLYVGSGGNEIRKGSIHYLDRLYINDGKGGFVKSSFLPDKKVSTTCVATGDIDQDGDNDFFTGSCIVPGSYTDHPESALLINDNSRFNNAPKQIMSSLGLRVNAARIDDMDDDGLDDIIVAGEWLGPSIIHNKGGQFIAEGSILPDLGGWWKTIEVKDLDGDGDLDIVAGNHGENSIFTASEDQPLTMLINDFDQNGLADPVLFKYTYGINGPFVNRDLFCSQMPMFNNQYFSFEAYGNARYANMFSEELKRTSEVYRAYEMRSCWFENTGVGPWVKHILPLEVQTMPVNTILVHDFNKDGRLDLLLGGGSNSNHYEYGAIDGKLILLFQQGNKIFQAVDTEIVSNRGPIKEIGLIDEKRIVIANNSGPLQIITLGSDLVN